MDLSDRLRRSMDESGLSLYRIAKDTETNYSTIHQFVTGRRGLYLTTAGKIFDYLGWKMEPPQPTRAKNVKRPGRKRTKKTARKSR